MPDRDKSLLECVVELDDGEDFIEVLPIEPRAKVVNNLAIEESNVFESFVMSVSETEHMVNYLINSYKRDNIILQKGSYDISNFKRKTMKNDVLPNQSTNSALSTQTEIDSESKLNTMIEVSKTKKQIVRCIYCSLQVDTVRCINIPKIEATVDKWLKSLSEDDVHVEELLRKRLGSKKTNYVLCDLHYDPNHVASFIMGYRLPWPKLPLHKDE
ncbi:unnamed protein product [Auanema sp. JU1783]|nr:unnamed protein product [Auanema sp. JU1783]